MSPFENIVEMLRIASSPAAISTIDYHNMVNILRHYDTHRQSPQEEQEILARVGTTPATTWRISDGHARSLVGSRRDALKLPRFAKNTSLFETLKNQSGGLSIVSRCFFV